jgi:hypothetical protein
MSVLVDKTAFDLLPREEALVRLYELISRFGQGLQVVESGACSPAQQHARETGHLLRFGCCAYSGEPSEVRE